MQVDFCKVTSELENLISIHQNRFLRIITHFDWILSIHRSIRVRRLLLGRRRKAKNKYPGLVENGH